MAIQIARHFGITNLLNNGLDVVLLLSLQWKREKYDNEIYLKKKTSPCFNQKNMIKDTKKTRKSNKI